MNNFLFSRYKPKRWLVPFHPYPQAPQIWIHLSSEEKNTFYKTFHIYFGIFSRNKPLEELMVLDPIRSTKKPRRLHELWKKTCFEIFIKIPHQPAYFEYNISPCGNWNAYSFTSMRFEQKLVSFENILNPVTIQEISQKPQEKIWKIKWKFPLKGIVPFPPFIHIGTTAILKTEKKLQYFALKHCDTKPNFHLPQSFCMRSPF